MKITKRMPLPSARIWVGTCNHCKSEAEAEESEMTGITNDQREGGRFSWERCPVCNVGPYGGMLFYPTKEPQQR